VNIAVGTDSQKLKNRGGEVGGRVSLAHGQSAVAVGLASAFRNCSNPARKR
jgi:hypothetical protein